VGIYVQFVYRTLFDQSLSRRRNWTDDFGLECKISFDDSTEVLAAISHSATKSRLVRIEKCTFMCNWIRLLKIRRSFSSKLPPRTSKI